MITACGWSPSQIAETLFCDVLDLTRYWADWPPVHEILKAAYGVETTPREIDAEELKTRKPPPGCLSIEELQRIATAHPVATMH